MNEEKRCAFDAGKKCTALAKKRCWDCAFFKTEEELREGRRKAAEKIRSLPITTRIILKLKYQPDKIKDETCDDVEETEEEEENEDD